MGSASLGRESGVLLLRGTVRTMPALAADRTLIYLCILLSGWMHAVSEEFVSRILNADG